MKTRRGKRPEVHKIKILSLFYSCFFNSLITKILMFSRL
jgi:hypothetical protein